MNLTQLNDLVMIGLLKKDTGYFSFKDAWLPAYLSGERAAANGESCLAGQWGQKAVLGVTGNIAVGKSTVLAMLADLGADVINADGLVHDLREPGRPGYRAILELFGSAILLPGGHIDTKQLAERAFQDKAILQELEQVFRPLVVAEVIRLGRRSDSLVVVVEALYLVDGALKDQVDQVWVVDATQTRQIERLIAHRGLTKEQAIQRVTSQRPQADKLALADVVIHNNADVAAAWGQVAGGWWLVLRDLYCQGWLTDALLQQYIQISLEKVGSDMGGVEALQLLRQASADMGPEQRLPIE